VPDIDQRDPDEVSQSLSGWLATKLQPGAAPAITDVNAPASNGFSNETILCTATWQEDGRSVVKPLVVRVAPTKHLLFLDAEFSLQYRVMKTLAEGGSGVPLPPLGWYEENPSWLGVPFFIMDHVEGLVPGDNLPYTMDGWVLEATADQRETMWWSGLEALTKVHQTDWRALGLDWLGDPTRGRPGLEQQLAYYREFLDWSSKGRPQPVTEAVWEWLIENRPEETGDVVLCWGDSRIGNIIWENFTPKAVLDWEMATLAQPELDLGWWLYFDRQFSEGLAVPRPAGFPSHEESIEWYAKAMGRPMQNVEYYEVFSGFRFAVIMCRLTDLLIDAGMLPADSDMGTNNLATQFTAQLLGLPSPAD
jgi:aminoglycoside phosphotransferase (APT) family kinase protein